MKEPKAKITPLDENGGHRLRFSMDHHDMEFNLGQYVQGSYHMNASDLREAAARFIFAADTLDALSEILNNEFELTD